MFLSRTQRSVGLASILLFTLVACNPVQFSTNSAKVTNDSTPTPTPSGSPTPTPTGSPTPTVSPTVSPTASPTPTSLRDVHYNSTVAPQDYKLDIVLIVDDSNSMLPDNTKLAAKLSNFVSNLQNSSIDWQMCATTTRALPIDNNGNTAWGASVYWQNSDTQTTSLGYILKKGTPDLENIFAKTINFIGAGWVGSEDERAIKSAYHHVYNGDYHYSNASGCYRADAAITYIIISNEDERSIGGDKSQQYYSNEYYPLESEDLPNVFTDYVKTTFGATKRFTVNSIIVKPSDTACMAQEDAAGTKSHFGVNYNTLSGLTGGGIGSICDADFSTNMNLFFAKVTQSLGSVPLECVPVGTPVVTITPSTSTTWAVQGSSIVLTPALSEGSTIDITYKCDASRSPSSEGGATELSFFAKIWNFITNLF